MMKVDSLSDAETFGHVVALEAAVRVLAVEIAKLSADENFLDTSRKEILRRLEAASAVVPQGEDPALRTALFSEAQSAIESIFRPQKSED